MWFSVQMSWNWFDGSIQGSVRDFIWNFSDVRKICYWATYLIAVSLSKVMMLVHFSDQLSTWRNAFRSRSKNQISGWKSLNLTDSPFQLKFAHVSKLIYRSIRYSLYHTGHRLQSITGTRNNMIDKSSTWLTNSYIPYVDHRSTHIRTHSEWFIIESGIDPSQYDLFCWPY